MHNVPLMQIIHCVKHLANSLCGILFGKLALLANAIEELSTSGKLGDDIPFILRPLASPSLAQSAPLAHLRLKPLEEFDNVWVLHSC